MDAFLAEDFKIVYRIAISILKVHEDVLLSYNTSQEVLAFLHSKQVTDRHALFEQLMRVAYRLPLKRSRIKQQEERVENTVSPPINNQKKSDIFGN